jgi:glycosyltransferase involved in cell wall biosynthesis
MRVYQLARHLAPDNDVTLLSYAEPHRAVSERERRAVCQRVRLVQRAPLAAGHRRVEQARSLLSMSPFNGRTLCTPDMQQALDDCLDDGYDLVQVETSPMMWLRFPQDVRVVLDEHNIESEVLQRMGRSERSLSRRLFNAAEAVKYRRIEERAWRQVAGCVVTSDREVPTVSRTAPRTPVAVVPNAVDPEHFHPASAASPVHPDRIVFTGLLSYRPNVDAVRFFIDDVLPRVRARRPAAVFQVVGDGPDSVLRSLLAEGVQVTGLVPDLRPYLARAACVVAPLRMGGGTRLKVLEALSMGTGLVSTRLGCEGIDVRHGEHLLIADEPDDVADAVCSLLADPDLRRALGQRGRQLVVDRYSWQRSAELLQEHHALIAGVGR